MHAGFLVAIAAKIEADDLLLQRANERNRFCRRSVYAENGGRTVRSIAVDSPASLEEGSWVAARIDHADPNRKPAPKPELRRMLIPIGPVVVFAASNFPLAFSVPGRRHRLGRWRRVCPVVVKAHPAHPGTSEWLGRIIL